MRCNYDNHIEMGKFTKATSEHKAEALNYPEPPLPRRHWSVNTQLCCDDSVTADRTDTLLSCSVSSAPNQRNNWLIRLRANKQRRPASLRPVCVLRLISITVSAAKNLLFIWGGDWSRPMSHRFTPPPWSKAWSQLLTLHTKTVFSVSEGFLVAWWRSHLLNVHQSLDNFYINAHFPSSHLFPGLICLMFPKRTN